MKQIRKFNKELSKIKYGWYDKEGKLHESLKDGNFSKNYRMQYIEDVKKHKSSICWDLCEVEREYFKKKKYSFMTVFAVLKKYKKKPCHTFLVFKDKGKYYWFESSWDKMKGVREYNSLEELFDEVRNNFEDFTKNKDFNKEEIEFYKYKKPKDKIGCNGFYIHCMYFGKKIKKNKKRLFK
jgi:hypothetical protein